MDHEKELTIHKMLLKEDKHRQETAHEECSNMLDMHRKDITEKEMDARLALAAAEEQGRR